MTTRGRVRPPRRKTASRKPQTENSILALFARAPRVGQVKTRLAAEIGAAAALAVYRAMLEQSARRFRGIAERSIIVFTPADAGAEFAALGAGWERTPQSDGSLGVRLRNFFSRAFAEGAARVVCVGTDSPTLPLPRVRRAFAVLCRCDAVLGPTDDGGYYLIGLSRFTPAPFTRIRWGSDAVLRQTLARCQKAGLNTVLLPAWFDVDTAADLSRLRAGLPAGSRLSRRLKAATGTKAPGKRS